MKQIFPALTKINNFIKIQKSNNSTSLPFSFRRRGRGLRCAEEKENCELPRKNFQV